MEPEDTDVRADPQVVRRRPPREVRPPPHLSDYAVDYRPMTEPRQTHLTQEDMLSADVLQLLVVKEEVPSEQREWSSSLDQEDPEPPHIKEEQEDHWTSQEGEQLQGLEEADIIKFTFTPVPVKSEDDEEKPQSSQLHQRLTEQMETEADGEDCGGTEPARNSDPDRHSDPDTEDETEESSEPETDNSDDWKETREPQSGLNSLNNDEVPVSDSRCSADVQQLLVVKEEVPPEQQEWSSNLDQEDPEPPHIKEEREELWTSQEGEQLQGLEEADITKFPFTPVPVKSEEDEKNPQSSQLHQRQTEQMDTEADGEDWGGPEPARNSDPEPDTVDKTGDSSETDVSDDGWTDTREPQSGLNSVINNVSNTDKESFTCSECGKTFGHKTNLRRHMICHTREKPFSCSFCNKSFNRREHLIAHMRCHSGEKPFSCSVCDTAFSHGWSLEKHMRVHTGEKPFSCSLCSKSFRQRSDLVAHFRIHTGEKPFSCSVCNMSFTQRHTLVQHMRTHTGVKPFVCPVCGKTFSRKGHLTRHLTAHTGEKPFSCSDCDKSFTWQSQLKRHECAGESSGATT
ncbi:zinc finger protein 260-like isoform X7 [Sebastes umbrosus]|uniref:zinc finger protein 260-like isoform X7 n=1 Tax=Sebastes umbrosus TaxID=72105 RepID=UPI00189E96CE|nr:zinc finger protein 260-like isoform X7 [Sebastes umbrosus]